MTLLYADSSSAFMMATPASLVTLSLYPLKKTKAMTPRKMRIAKMMSFFWLFSRNSSNFDGPCSSSAIGVGASSIIVKMKYP